MMAAGPTADRQQEKAMNPITLFLTMLLLGIGGAVAGLVSPVYGAPIIVLALIVAASLKMANTWEKFVVLRAGNLQGVHGPGLFLIIPVVDSVVAVIDERIQTTAFNAEQALTRDTVPVNVDAIIFWKVHDARKAALDITNYREAIDRVAQTSLREMIGSSMLGSLLSDRKAADERLREVIGVKTAEWGVTVISVEIRDVAIPVALQDAMSRQAQAEREKQARRRNGRRIEPGIKALRQPGVAVVERELKRHGFATSGSLPGTVANERAIVAAVAGLRLSIMAVGIKIVAPRSFVVS
jgi:regulator of protease activity HflC (stomatin/prohibitin superfamily)